MKTLILLVLILLCGNSLPQAWQPMGIPEGSGVTDLVYWSGGGAVFGDKLWATTGSVDWPNGQRGGVFYSAISGPYQGTWYRLGGSAGYYVGRTLEVGHDGNLYASLWRDPAQFPADALCRFVPQAATFGVLYQAQAGDNIFSIAVKNSPHTIFAGTRNGIIRSTDNGVSFQNTSSGIPANSWVRDLELASNGTIIAATTNGVFFSTDNGDSWLMAAGVSPADTVCTLVVLSDTTTSDGSNAGDFEYVIAGTIGGEILKGILEEATLTFEEVYFFTGDPEVAGIVAFFELAEQVYYLLAALYDVFGTDGGVAQSLTDGEAWEYIDENLPEVVSAIAHYLPARDNPTKLTTYTLFAGVFNNTTNGAGVYKLDLTTDVEQIDNQIPSDYLLEQNYPNPFNPSTKIQFAVPKESFTRLEIFNTLGEKVSTLVSETLSTGTYEYEWNAEGLPSGVYFYRLSTNSFSELKKMILLR
jgi:hypothetical protein